MGLVFGLLCSWHLLPAASSELAHMILPTNMQPTQLSYVDEALVIWSQGCQEQPLTGVAAHYQKSWDSLRLFSMADTLSKNTTDELNRARLLAASCKESGAWLNALPITSLGLRMDDTTIRISMGLRLGIPLCRNHICQHCGAEVSQFATHGLSCKKSAGRHYRHSAINDIIHRALVATHVPSRLEPQVYIARMESDLMELQQFHGNVANFLYGMPLAQIRMHHLTPQLQHSKLEQLANKRRIRRHNSTNTLAHTTFSLLWQSRHQECMVQEQPIS